MSIDPHTNYLGPRAAENFDISMKLSLEGIGAVLQARDEYTAIREVVPGGPAAKSGKVQGGRPHRGVGEGTSGPMVDVIGWRLDDVVKLIRGKKDTTVRLEILPADAGVDGKHELITLVRQKVSIEEQAAKKNDHRGQGRQCQPQDRRDRSADLLLGFRCAPRRRQGLQERDARRGQAARRAESRRVSTAC